MEIEFDEINLILSGVLILQDLEVETIQDIARNIQLARFDNGQTIVRRGQAGARLYIIVDGKVQVHVDDKVGHETRVIDLSKGSVIGEISLLSNQPYSADVVASSEVTALYLDRNQFVHLIQQHKAFAETLSCLMSERMSENGDLNRVGRYQLRDRLGEGAMAIVFNAYDPELEREVAIKMLKYELAYDQQFIGRFEREARTIAGLNHPNIVNVFEIIDEFSTRFIVMEKILGNNLAERLLEHGAFSPEQARDILFPVACALQYAHGQGIVHRDIKPSNIQLDPYGNVKLTDFGISGPPQDRAESIEGSPSYLAPEVIKGAATDGRADIYALGVMAFHLLTNSLPFSANTLEKVLAMQIGQRPPDIRNYVRGIDDDFATFIESAMAKDVDERISDWNEIRRLLKPEGRDRTLALDRDEFGVIIRFRDAPFSDTARVIHSIKDVLDQSGLKFTIEMQQGGDDSGQ